MLIIHKLIRQYNGIMIIMPVTSGCYNRFMKSRHIIKTSGFTLIELSIVLVIIGLITGSILVGRDLIRAAEIRSVASDKEKIITAVNTFKTKYNCLPGDCPSAVDFFGTNPAGCPPPAGSAPSMQTCNGSGIGKIGYGAGNEQLYFWQHLAAAGLWPGIFRGTSNALVNATLEPTVIPQITGNPSNYWWVEHTMTSDFAGYELGQSFGYQHLIISTPAGHPTSNTTYSETNHLFTPSEALAFDIKFDDGKPASGNIQVLNDWTLWECTNPQENAPNAAYDTTKITKNCNVVFLNIGF